jgi:nucleotide-binding universal stress UspA family protein
MRRFKSILVATDTRLDRQPVLHTAAEVAINNKASLKIVDVVPDLSWAVRLTLQDHEHVQDLLRQEKIQQLESLAVPIRDQGIEVETKLLEGKTSVEIVREVLRGEHDLVVAVAKGNKSRHSGFFWKHRTAVVAALPHCGLAGRARDGTPSQAHFGLRGYVH